MKRAIAVLPAGIASDLRVVDTLLLDYSQRERPQGSHTALRGAQIEMALTGGARLRTDDRLVLDDDTLIEIVAQPEPLYELRASHSSELARMAWMLGDRHLPVDITERRLRVRRDPVVETMLGSSGVRMTPIEAPFEPEGGAYSPGTAAASHDHVHDHAHCGHDHHDH
jgi:urease accessory protein